ncbi:ABC transporter ATP-binding protein [Pseudooceanicola nanhaiensis]|uniref:ABC transporter ATP-binding protein n=1 Tax=Pseudooceanicola nanhaiensis TaxID=375761 RepID=UPI001CD69607|nr:ABC transporter ATP-binding protein [Pseudooceanicola nanhaiensis]MCA0921891.1 ABC transporter ATP-binding protein [Pseudooceanicola nanhaiensis]
MSDAILSVRDLKLSVKGDAGLAQILDHVDFSIHPGEVLGLVGESGCGKSTLIRSIMGLPPKGARIESGSVTFKGQSLMDPKIAQTLRGREIGFIPQDPFQAFNPVFTVGDQILEILRWSGLPDDPKGGRYTKELRAKHRARLIEVLHAVQIPDPEEALTRFPHQFSGGQRQRILIAGALASRPSVILADEPTTALDVTTQMQILRLLRELAKDFNVAMLFVTHDFGVVAQICDRVTVMYAGQTVETGTTRQIIDAPRHPYTGMLMACHPERATEITGIPGQVSSPLTPPPGCRFAPRCPRATEACTTARPGLDRRADGRRIACIHEKEVA